MQRHKIVRKASVGVLLFLPLVAVGIALALMLSLGHQGAQQASADASTDIEFSMRIAEQPPCLTGPPVFNPFDQNKCTFSEGDSFTLVAGMDSHKPHVANPGDTPPDNVATLQIAVAWTGAVSGPAPGNNKALTVLLNACILIPGGGNPASSVPGPLGPNSLLAGCAVNTIGFAVPPGDLFTAEFNCASAGVGFIIMPHSASDTFLTDGFLSQHTEDSFASFFGAEADILQINCEPPQGEININKTNKDSGDLIAGSCWEIFARINVAPPLSQPVFVNKSLDTVSDNNAVGQCDTAGQADLSDANPVDGQVDIIISGAIQVAAGTNVFAFQETKAPPKFVINDSTKYDCTFTNTAKGNGVGCDEDGGGAITIANARIEGNINITFSDPFGGAQTDACVDIDQGVGNVCDGDDGNSDGSISLVLANDVYNVALDPASIDLALVVPKDPTKVQADLDANKSVNIKFSFNTAKPTFEKKKGLANLFLTAQGVKLDPANCEDSTDVAIFTMQLNNPPNSQNEKGDPQDVRAFEYEIRFDGGQVCVSFTPGKFVANNGMTCTKTTSEEKGLIEVGCVTQKTTPQVPIDNSNLQLGVIEVRPQPSLYSIIKATQDNGVVVQIRNDQCNLADLEGHKINAAPIGVGSECPDSDLTIRWLEGDVNGDCIVDTADQQLLAFRWGVSKGVQLYNARFNLVGDLETINIKDVQFVFGRHNSKCDQFNSAGQTGPTNPPQPPVNKKTASP